LRQKFVSNLFRAYVFFLQFRATCCEAMFRSQMRLLWEIILPCPRHCWQFPIITWIKHNSKPGANSHDPDLGRNISRAISGFTCRARSSFNQPWLKRKGLKTQVKKNRRKIFSCLGS
jgi:hypothetical protein